MRPVGERKSKHHSLSDGSSIFSQKGSEKAFVLLKKIDRLPYFKFFPKKMLKVCQKLFVAAPLSFKSFSGPSLESVISVSNIDKIITGPVDLSLA